ncbi:MAG: 1,4-dihydroxy-2-naphthoate polyprenyltransferase [Nakamurella sp.]
MATLNDWISASRPRTLPAAVAPVLVGSGAAEALNGFRPGLALLCLLVSLALQVGVNFANDYSDGVRGTDAVRVGPTRLTASGVVTPRQVKAAAFAAFAVAGVAGLVLAVLVTWWLVPVGVVCILAAWFYTGGPRPYGYAGYGEAFVFTFFGLVAVLGTTYVQARGISVVTVAAAIGIGLLACALLVANNLRDVHTDASVGKRTLAVIIGEPMTRKLFALMIAVAFLAIIVVGLSHPWCLLALLAAPLALDPIRRVIRGAAGRDLIAVLGATGRLELAYAVALTVGLVLD